MGLGSAHSYLVIRTESLQGTKHEMRIVPRPLSYLQRTPYPLQRTIKQTTAHITTFTMKSFVKIVVLVLLASFGGMAAGASVPKGE